jgi:uncharacterized membrane protein YagU involved in acid resistance
MARRGSWTSDAVVGGLAGGAAVWLMDQTTSGLLAAQPTDVTEREEAARPNGRSSVENLVVAVDERLDLGLDDQARTRVGTAVHYALGIVPGAIYGVARRRVPAVGAANGLLFGAFLWAVNDEYLNAALGLSAPPGDYPVETHWRGFVGHAVLGVATDTGLALLRR